MLKFTTIFLILLNIFILVLLKSRSDNHYLECTWFLFHCICFSWLLVKLSCFLVSLANFDWVPDILYRTLIEIIWENLHLLLGRQVVIPAYLEGILLSGMRWYEARLQFCRGLDYFQFTPTPRVEPWAPHKAWDFTRHSPSVNPGLQFASPWLLLWGC